MQARGWVREPAVAGRFYTANPTSLRNQLETFFKDAQPDPSTVAVMAPHAGYQYSGKIAGDVYRRLTAPERAIILAPNHTGYGKVISVWPRGAWRTPLGEVKVDQESAEWLLGHLEDPEGDRDAHESEHAVEVHVPFLQFLNPNIEILPIVLARLSPEDCADFGKWIAKLVHERPSLIVASTDMSHYIPASVAKGLDQLALDRVAAVDGAGLYDVVRKKDISMCGFIPTTCVLEALSARGIKKGELLEYGHSGEVTGDNTSVVGYAGARFTRSI